MNIILEDLPKSVTINGHRYGINYDFRTGIRMDIVFHDKRMSDQDRYMEMCRLFYDDITQLYVEDVEKAVHRMLWFYTRGNYEQKEEKSMEGGTGTTPKKSQREFCFIQDSELIYGAFLKAYGMRLGSIPRNELHWWEFMALFRSLPPETEIRQYIYYRTCDISKLPKSQQKAVRDMRSKIKVREAVPDNEMSNSARLEKHNRELLNHARIIAQSNGKGTD